jgi:hypothetical protein
MPSGSRRRRGPTGSAMRAAGEGFGGGNRRRSRGAVGGKKFKGGWAAHQRLGFVIHGIVCRLYAP